VLRAGGPADAHIDLIFSLGASERRSQVDVDFEPGAGTTSDAARTVITALAALLRSNQPLSPTA
jgi:hypothetical protein